jgi:menaquinone-dependent protoporphyrinogen IX oxidase
MRTAFLSVSLSQAGAQDEHATPDNRARATADVKRMIDVFLAVTQWHPTLIQPVAGVLMYSRYNFLVRFIMKHAARVQAPIHHAIMSSRDGMSWTIYFRDCSPK